MDFYEAKNYYAQLTREERDLRRAEIMRRRSEIAKLTTRLWSEDDGLRRERMAIDFLSEEDGSYIDCERVKQTDTTATTNE
jgi:hypothetical protein